MPRKFRATTNDKYVQQQRRAIGKQHRKLDEAKTESYEKLLDGLAQGVNFATNGNRKVATFIFVLLAIDLIHRTQIATPAHVQPYAIRKMDKLGSNVLNALTRYGLAGMAITNTAQKSPLQRLTLFGAGLLGGQFFPAAEAKGLESALLSAIEGQKRAKKKIDEAIKAMQEALQVSPTIATPQQSGPAVSQQNQLSVIEEISSKFNRDIAEVNEFIETKNNDANRVLGKAMFKFPRSAKDLEDAYVSVRSIIAKYDADIDKAFSDISLYISNDINRLSTTTPMNVIHQTYNTGYKKIDNLKEKYQKKWEFFYKIALKFNHLNNALIKFAELLNEANKMPDRKLLDNIEQIVNKYEILTIKAEDNHSSLTSLVLHEALLRSLFNANIDFDKLLVQFNEELGVIHKLVNAPQEQYKP